MPDSPRGDTPAATGAPNTHQTKRADSKAARYQTRPAGFAEKSLGFQTIWVAQNSAIFPSTHKAVLVNLATYVNSTTGLAFPGLSRLAWNSGISESQAKRIVRELKDAGLVESVTTGGGSQASRLRINLEVTARGFSAVARRAMPEEAIATRFTHEPGSPMNPVHGGTGRGVTHEPGGGSPVSYEPHNPTTLVVGGGVGGAPSGSATPPLGHAPEIPAQLSRVSFEALVSMGKDTPARRDALAAKAFDLVKQGHDVESLARLAIELDLKTYARSPREPPARTAPARTSRRKAARGIHLGDPNGDWGLLPRKP